MDPACSYHITDEELREQKEKWRRLRERGAQMPIPTPSYWPPTVKYQPPPEYDETTSTKPLCWFWTATDEDRATKTFHQWHPDACAICGGYADVLDHDHFTGWIRGYLCRGCNISEGSNNSIVFQRYRKWNPARIFDAWERYWSPFSGFDWGMWGDTRRWPAVPVAPDGTMLFFVEPAIRRDARLSAFLTERFAPASE